MDTERHILTERDIYRQTHSQTNPLTDKQNRQIDRHTNNKQHNLVLINGINNVIGHSKEFQVDLRPLAPR